MADRTLLVSGVPYEPTEPGTVYSSAERAAVAALVHTRTNATLVQNRQLQAGSIVRVEGGYSWIPARRSASASSVRQDPTVRLPVTEGHVALYVVHPRLGEPRIDRMNERLTRAERRLVDEADPLHRPMFVLTPSGRVVSYYHGNPEDQIADMRMGRPDPVAFVVAQEAPVDRPAVPLAAGSR